LAAEPFSFAIIDYLLSTIISLTIIHGWQKGSPQDKALPVLGLATIFLD
jgi:hypothetical protein